MSNLSRGIRSVPFAVVLLAVALLLVGCPEAEDPAPEAEELTEISVSSLAFPSMISTFTAIMQDQEIGRQHGFDVTVTPYTDIGAFYGAQATGEVDAGIGGPAVYQRLANEGAELQVVATFGGLETVVVMSRTDEIQSIDDMVGRSIAASTGSAEFQILSIYANSHGINLFEDAEVVEASPPEARSQMEAGRVDTALMFEPTTSLTLYDNPDFSLIFHGHEAWEELTGEPNWQLVTMLRRDFIQQHPEAIERWIEALQATQTFIEENPEESARIVRERLELPEEVFLLAQGEGRLAYDIHPVWQEGVDGYLWTMFQMANTHGYADALPPDDILYRPE